MMAKKPKILICYDYLSEIGGLERVMFSFAKLLAESYEVDLLFAYVDEARKDAITSTLELAPGINIQVAFKDKIESLALIKSFLNPSVIHKYQADLIISNSFLGNLWASRYARRHKIPYITVMHHPPNFLYSQVSFKHWINNPSRFLAFILGKLMGSALKRKDRETVKRAGKVIVSSVYTQKRVKQLYQRDAVLIYPPVSSFFKPLDKLQAQNELQRFALNPLYVLYHGRIIPDKRPDLFLEIAARLQGCQFKAKPLQFIISGDISAKMEEELQKGIKARGVENIKILGRVSQQELRALYNLAELLVVTAPKEDFGLTLIEALACGTPVVAWDDKAGPNETVIPEVNGLLAPPYEVDAMAKLIKVALKKYWNNEEVCASVNKFSLTVVKAQLFSVVQDILG